jgi:hypothetical protein
MIDWFLPSVYGDIKLTNKSKTETTVTIAGLSPTERDAVTALLQHSKKPGRLSNPWLSGDPDLDLGSLSEQTFVLAAPISKVQKFLSSRLKPHRKQLSVVRFTNGRLEEVTESTLAVIDTAGEASEETTKPAKPAPVIAATVARPVIGCPAPDFDEAEVRATRVLSRFLDKDQLLDFRAHQQFMAVGADTGHRYILTSRHCRSRLAERTRTLFDLDENMPLCVHDWEVPAAEELLGLLLHLQIRGAETYVRSIPDRQGILA